MPSAAVFKSSCAVCAPDSTGFELLMAYRRAEWTREDIDQTNGVVEDRQDPSSQGLMWCVTGMLGCSRMLTSSGCVTAATAFPRVICVGIARRQRNSVMCAPGSAECVGADRSAGRTSNP